MHNRNSVESLCVEAINRISATVTHELKNTLSIINENAGFLNDLALMSGKDGSIPSQRVEDATNTIAQQVIRSNNIIKNLNRFSHSGDTPISQAKLLEVLQLMVELTARQAASSSVEVHIQCPEHIQLNTSLLPLEALVFSVLNTFYSVTDADGKITLEAKLQGTDAVIHFKNSNIEKNALENYTPGEKETILAQAIQGMITSSQDSIVITFGINKS